MSACALALPCCHSKIKNGDENENGRGCKNGKNGMFSAFTENGKNVLPIYHLGPEQNRGQQLTAHGAEDRGGWVRVPRVLASPAPATPDGTT
eukprot:scaffold260096_cov23-Tisochrysis_lutea.AAC.1